MLRMFALGNGNTNESYSDMDFSFVLAASGELRVYDGGAVRGTFGTYQTGDNLEIAVESGAVKYRRNGALVYTSTLTPVSGDVRRT